LIPTPTPAPEVFNPDSFWRGVELAFSAIPIWIWIPLIVLGVLRMAMIFRERSEQQERKQRGPKNTER